MIEEKTKVTHAARYELIDKDGKACGVFPTHDLPRLRGLFDLEIQLMGVRCEGGRKCRNENAWLRMR